MKAHLYRAGAAPAALAAMLLSAPAAAQAAVADEGQIVVTGTLIRGAVEQAPAPVEVITAEDLALQGSPTAVDLIKLLPGSAGVLGDAAQFDTRSQFNEGTASINLRGLGPQRTLVLLNGNRLAATGGGNVPTVDINLIPWGAIDRIEILKDGAAATYGSDAIAGVVNFITRTDQDGFLASGDYRYVRGSDGDWTGALSWGGDLGPARVFVAGGYQHRSELAVTDRDWALQPYGVNPQGGFSGGGSPGNFDFNGSTGGIRFDADEGCEALGGFRSLPGSTADLCNTNYLAFSNIVEPEDRFQLFADIELPLSDRLGLRLTGLYGHTDTVLTTSPSYLPTIAPSGNAAFGGSGLFVIPSYAPALIDYCRRYGAAAGCDADAAGNPQSSALAYPVRFRPLLLGGNPLFDNSRMAAKLPRNSDLYQVTGELAYDLAPALTLTGGVTFSEYDRYFEGGDNFVDLFQNALAGFGGENCAYATPQSRAGLTQAQLAALAGTDGCQFFNPFSTATQANVVTGQANPEYAGASNPFGFGLAPGAGLINDASTVDDFFTIIQRRANIRQWVGNLVLSGESGVQLPGGAVRFALGGQYRDDRYVREYGATNNLDVYPCPGSVLNPAATCNPEVGPVGFLGSNRNVDVASDVWAVFAEAQLPITDRITAQIAARYEDYGAGVGSTFDPQARISAELTDWLSVRGGVGTTFRGPPPQSTLSDLVILTFIGGAFRAVDTLGNRDLDPESATTYNAGLLIDRGRFRASLDWWRYDFSGGIENEPVNGIVAALFGATGSANCGDPAYAGLQTRFTFSGGICGASNVQRLRSYTFNSADVRTSGLDFQASYEADLGAAVVQTGVSGTYVIEYEVGDVVVEGIMVQPAFDAVGKLNYQTTAYPLPQWKGYGWVQGLFGPHALRLQVNYIDGTTDQRGADVFGPNCAVLACAAVTGGKQVGSFTTLDASWRWSLPTRTILSVALTNLFDTDPPFARLDQNYDPLTASPLGFTAKVGVSQAF
ncbi:TonB-dependent receptor plug domain-containing protein [Altericroceibacterium xinjiangense]|uniref:TonB-dependent receptor plug domain-containing protein n=1 Tax=Altericroceibacterium xinjiangense TaxID=762261 RepID=UPI000F7DF964|nr:TonB-dependent receptor [Altericroceibacterium xinjiangense]